MELRQIQYFIQLYQDRNITRASKNLYISQQGLSKSVSRLEEELGFSLFDRHTSGVVPTREADALFVHFNKIANSYQELQLAIDALRQNRVLKIAAYHGFALSCSQDLLSSYRAFYPQAAIRYQEYENPALPEQLLCRQADLAFMRGPIPETLHSLHILCREPVHLIVDKRHPLAEKDSIHLQDLRQQKLLLLSGMEDFNNILLRQLAREGVSCPVQGTADINAFLPILHGSPLAGFGSRRMYQYHHFPDIVFLPLAPEEYEAHPELVMETHLVTPAGMTEDDAAQQFIDYIKQKLRSDD